MKRVAVVGSGLGGLSVSHFLSKSTKYKTTVLESEKKVGMDVASVTVKDHDNNQVRLDAPMRGISKNYYPTLFQLYNYLNIETIKSKNELCWSNWHTKQTIFNFFRLSNWVLPNIKSRHDLIFIFEFIRITLYSVYLKLSKKLPLMNCTIEEYLKKHHFNDRFINEFFIPFMVAIGTCTHREMLNYPAKVILHLVASTDYIYYHAKGGVQNVCSKLLVEDVVYNCTVVGAWQTTKGIWILRDQNGVMREFDYIIFACQATIAKAILEATPPPPISNFIKKPNQKLLNTLSEFHHKKVKVFIHMDDNLMPRDPKSWKGLHVCTDGNETMGTIWMNYTLDLPPKTTNYFETSNIILNPKPNIPNEKVISFHEFPRSTVTIESCEAIDELDLLQGIDQIYFVGSWVWPGMPLLEGCVASAVRVSESMGLVLPWRKGVSVNDEYLNSSLMTRYLNNELYETKEIGFVERIQLLFITIILYFI
jgi:predicted NAD/FAD-binding protein